MLADNQITVSNFNEIIDINTGLNISSIILQSPDFKDYLPVQDSITTKKFKYKLQFKMPSIIVDDDIPNELNDDINKSPKAIIFVLMPFSNDFRDVYFGIKSACNSVDAACERVDEQVVDDSIIEQVYKEIKRADIIISDMTGKNANVFYETGYAKALGKKIIFITQKAEDIVFDVLHYQHIIYKGSVWDLHDALVDRLTKELKRITSNR